ncbi:LuxR C-terminal-related transcriptional regulator [Microbacterium paludicola]|uniref:response regulator transcription factor n=1 Tax=Microbacterium paludicola TaxID=300019 RepID=UPI0028D28097|nr:LuxR C-terminal-related transcriptional regulator [Microbacterium paludicola]
MAAAALAVEGYSNSQIAGLIHLAEGTVKNHVSSILAKLGARDRTNAVLRAIREGMLG